MSCKHVIELMDKIGQTEFRYKNELAQNRFWLMRAFEGDPRRMSSRRPNYLLDIWLVVIFLIKVPFFLFLGCRFLYVEHGRKYLHKGRYIDPFLHTNRTVNRSRKLVVVSSSREEKLKICGHWLAPHHCVCALLPR